MAGVTVGYIYLLESDAVDNQNWLHDPDTIVVGNFTEPTDICSIPLPQDWMKRFNTGVTISHLGGASFPIMWDNKFYSVMKRGMATTIANSEKVEKFCMADRHTATSVATFHQYYLVIPYASGSYVEFWDHDNNRREYCKGLVTDGIIMWNDMEHAIATIKLNWQSTW